jgi:hypothetical protein
MSVTKEFNRERFTGFISQVNQEILNMQSGEGRFRPGALHFEVGKASPVLNRLKMLEENPIRENLDQFLIIAKQDFGAPTAQAFTDWSHSIFPEVKKDKNLVAPKAFDVALKDGFYDLFKACRIPLEPKQLILLEKGALRLAQTFKQEISRTVGEQLGVLVKSLKAKEEKKD